MQSQEAITTFINKVRSTPTEQSIKLSVRQKDTDQVKDIVITPREMVLDPAYDPSRVGPPSIGVMLSPNYVSTEFVHTKSVPEAIVLAANTVSDLTADTASSIFHTIGAFTRGDSSAGMGMRGPIGVIKMGSEVVRSNDVNAVIAFAAAISINLAVVNSLPLPALDGGQMLFILSEAFAGRKIDQRVEEEINAAALLLLLLASFGTAIGDLK